MSTPAQQAQHTGAMIALSVPDSDQYALYPPTESSVQPGDLHITLAYLGEAAEISPEERDAILDACQVLADTSDAPEGLFPATTGVFPPDPEAENATNVPYYAQPMPTEPFGNLRNDLLVHLGARGVANLVSTKHPVFHPHVTLTYATLDDAPDLSYLPTPVPVSFGTLICKFGDEVHEFSLNSQADGPELPITASVQANLRAMSYKTQTSEEYLLSLYLQQRQVKATPAQSRAQAALNRVAKIADPTVKTSEHERIEALLSRATLETSDASRLYVANRALALASRTTPSGPQEARELAALTASIKALIADGNSSAARSLRARAQLRDRYGRWIEEGRGIRFKLKGAKSWTHAIATGFNVAQGRVIAKTEDGQTVSVPANKVEQPKAIIGLKVPGLEPKSGSSFKPQSKDRQGKASLPGDFNHATAEANKAQDAAAVKSMEKIQKTANDAAPDAKVSGGNIAPLVNDPNLIAAEKALQAGETKITFTPSKNPLKDVQLTLDKSDVDSVRASLDRITNENMPSAEQLAGLSEDQKAKAVTAARGKAYSAMASLYNERGADPELARMPSVKPEDIQVLDPNSPEAKGQFPEISQSEMVRATQESLNELEAAVNSAAANNDSQYEKQFNRIKSSVDSANERFLAGKDNQEQYLNNLDKLKNFANSIETKNIYKGLGGQDDHEAQAFSAFAEDLDNIHKSVGGSDKIADAKNALQGIEDLVNTEKGNAANDGETHPNEGGLNSVEDMVYHIRSNIESGKYLTNTDSLANDLNQLHNEASKELEPDAHAAGAYDEAMSNLEKSAKAVDDLVHTPQEAAPVAPEAPQAPQGINNPGSYFDDIPSEWQKSANEFDKVVGNAADAFANVTKPTDGQQKALEDFHTAISNIDEAGWGGLVSENTPVLLSHLDDATAQLEKVFKDDPSVDQKKLDSIGSAADSFKSAVKDSFAEQGMALDLPSDKKNQTAPTLGTFQSIHDRIQSIYNDLPPQHPIKNELGAFGNQIGNVGKKLQAGYLTPQDAGQMLSEVSNDFMKTYGNSHVPGEPVDLNLHDSINGVLDSVDSLQKQLADGHFDSGASQTPQSPTTGPNLINELSPEHYDALDNAVKGLDTWFEDAKSSLNHEPDFESGQGKGYKEPVQAKQDLQTFEDAIGTAIDAYAHGEATHDDFFKAVVNANHSWLHSEGFKEATAGDHNGDLHSLFDASDHIDNILSHVPDQNYDIAQPEQPAADQPHDPWAGVGVSSESNKLLNDFEKTTADSETVLANNHSSEAQQVEKTRDSIKQALQETNPSVDDMKDLIDKLNMHYDSLTNMEEHGTPDEKTVASVEKEALDPAIESLKKDEAAAEVNADAINSNPALLQAVIDKLKAGDSSIGKIVADHLENNKGNLSEADVESIKNLVDLASLAKDVTPQEKAQYQQVKDDLNLADPALPDLAKEAEKPATPEAPAAPATSNAQEIESWKNSDLQNWLNDNAASAQNPEITHVGTGVWNELSPSQVTDFSKITANKALDPVLKSTLNDMLNQHLAGKISDDDLIQALSSAAIETGNKSLSGKLSGLQAGIQNNNTNKIKKLTPEESLYVPKDGKPVIASPDTINDHLAGVINHANIAQDLATLNPDTSENDKQVKNLLDQANAATKDALDTLHSGDIKTMAEKMREAVDAFDKARDLRDSTDKQDKLRRRIQMRRRSIDEVLAAFENRLPDPKVVGNAQKYDGPWKREGHQFVEDKFGNKIYPGDKFVTLGTTTGDNEGHEAIMLGSRKSLTFGTTYVHFKKDNAALPQNNTGISTNGIELAAVGPNNPLYHDPTYTGPKVDTTKDLTKWNQEYPKALKHKVAQPVSYNPATGTHNSLPTTEAPSAPAAPETPKLAKSNAHIVADMNKATTPEEIDQIISDLQHKLDNNIGPSMPTQLLMQKAEEKKKQLLGKTTEPATPAPTPEPTVSEPKVSALPEAPNLPSEFAQPPAGSKVLYQTVPDYAGDHSYYAVQHPDGKLYFYNSSGKSFVTNSSPEDLAKSPEIWEPAKPVTAPAVNEPGGKVKTYDISGWTKGKGMGGSNGATLYTAPDGTKYVVKPVSGPNFTPSQHTADMEALASIIYNELGHKAPEIGFTTLPNGKPAVVSTFTEHTPLGKLSGDELAAAKQKLYDNYAIDTWLANYDLIGLGHENVGVDSEGNLVYVDNGGAFDVKAQGDNKAWWGNDAKDFDMWSSGVKPTNSSAWNATIPFYNGISNEQKILSAQKLQQVSDQQIFDMVAKIPTMSDPEKKKLAQTLINRRDSILKKAGLDVPSQQPANGTIADANTAPLDKFGNTIHEGDTVVHHAKTTGKVFQGTVVKASGGKFIVRIIDENGQPKLKQISPEKWVKLETENNNPNSNFTPSQMATLTAADLVVHSAPDPTSPWYGKPAPEKPESKFSSTIDDPKPLLGSDWYNEAEKQYHAYLTGAGKPVKPLNTSASWHHYQNVINFGMDVSLEKLHDKNKIDDNLYQQAKDAIAKRNADMAAEAADLAQKLAVWKTEYDAWMKAQGKPSFKLPTHADLAQIPSDWSETKKIAHGMITPTSEPGYIAISSQKGASDHNGTNGARNVLKPGDDLSIDAIVANPNIGSGSKDSLVSADKLIKTGKYTVPVGKILRGARTNSFHAFRKKDGSKATSASDFDDLVGTIQMDAGLMEMSIGAPEDAGYAYMAGGGQVIMNIHALPGVSGSYTGTQSFSSERGFVFHGPMVYLITGVKKNQSYPHKAGESLSGGGSHNFPVEVEVVAIPQSLYEQFGHFKGIDWINNPPIHMSGPTNIPTGPTNVPKGPENIPGGPTNVPKGPENLPGTEGQ